MVIDGSFLFPSLAYILSAAYMEFVVTFLSFYWCREYLLRDHLCAVAACYTVQWAIGLRCKRSDGTTDSHV